MTVHANIKTYNAAVARLGAAKILLLPISRQLSSVILSKILHSWHLVILLTIIFLHVAQFGDNEIAFPHIRHGKSIQNPFGSRHTHCNRGFYSRYYHAWGFQRSRRPTLRLSSSDEKHCFQSIYYYKYHSHGAILFCCLYPPIHATIVSRAESWRLFFPTGLNGLLPFHICHGSNGAGICHGHIRCVNAFLGSCPCQFCHRIVLLHPGLFRKYRMFRFITRNIENGFVLDF